MTSLHRLSRTEAIERIDSLAQSHTPFLFIIDYDMTHCYVLPLDQVDPELIAYDFNGKTNLPAHAAGPIPEVEFHKTPMGKEQYQQGFEHVIHGLKRGDSFLTNYTAATPIQTNLSLLDIFKHTRAKYRLYVKDLFCCFSPEIFVQTRDNTIHTFPMKGTIDASLPHARQTILEDPKEAAEHATIVDLMRNDLSMVASQVQVKDYRYIDTLQTNQGALLQVSSHIQGALSEQALKNIGSTLFRLLPAGSISGAPKAKTCQIIAQAEMHPRGFYTGVAGIFDGHNIDSGVLIRFIAQDDKGNKFFHSGGGITAKSNLDNEYDELIQKVYLPIY